MSPWLLVALFTAGINLSLFVFARGRWDRWVPLFALVALVGVMLGSAAGDLMGITWLRIGDFNMLAASVTAQLAMVATVLLGVAMQAREEQETE